MTALRSLTAALAITGTLACTPAIAAPTVIAAGQVVEFEFQTTPYSYGAVQFVINFKELDDLVQPGSVTAMPSFPSTISFPFVCSGALNTPADISECVTSVEAVTFSSGGFDDGNFGIRFFNSGTGNAKFSVDPYAKLYAGFGATEFTRLNPIGYQETVPEPSALALAALALVGAGLSRRRKA